MKLNRYSVILSNIVDVQTENVSTELCKVKVSNDELMVRQTALEAEVASVREAKQQQMRMWWQAERDAELAAGTVQRVSSFLRNLCILLLIHSS